MKKFIIPILATVLVLFCATAGFLYFNANYIIIDGEVYSRDLTELDFSTAPVEELNKLTEMTGLKSLDIRGTDLTVLQYEHLQNAMPECTIAWRVPFQGSYYALDTQSLKISSITKEEFSILAYFRDLKTIDAMACQDFGTLLALQEAYPNCAVQYEVPVGDLKWRETTTLLSLKGASAEALAAAMPYLPKLETVDAIGCQDFEKLLALQAEYPGCNIQYAVTVGGEPRREDTTELTLENADGAEVLAALPYLPKLTTVTFTGATPDNETIYQMKTARPDVTFIWTFELLGKKVSSQDKEINLSGRWTKSVEPVENSLKYFNQLERVIMSNCGISNAEMDALGKRNPDVRFVWSVQLGNDIRLRTDATYFMPFQYNTEVTDKDLKNLKYCTDLICIDLGHMDVSDSSFLQYMPKMQYLLLADTKISDISACANMPDLIYAEFFMSRVRDYSPLVNCKKLTNLNICYTYPRTLDPIYELTQLEQLWIKGFELSSEKRKALQEALPNAKICYGYGSATGNGWRKSANYYKMRDILGMYYIDED